MKEPVKELLRRKRGHASGATSVTPAAVSVTPAAVRAPCGRSACACVCVRVCVYGVGRGPGGQAGCMSVLHGILSDGMRTTVAEVWLLEMGPRAEEAESLEVG